MFGLKYCRPRSVDGFEDAYGQAVQNGSSVLFEIQPDPPEQYGLGLMPELVGVVRDALSP